MKKSLIAKLTLVFSISRFFALTLFVLSIVMFYQMLNIVLQHSGLSTVDLIEIWDSGILGTTFLLLGVMIWGKLLY